MTQPLKFHAYIRGIETMYTDNGNGSESIMTDCPIELVNAIKKIFSKSTTDYRHLTSIIISVLNEKDIMMMEGLGDPKNSYSTINIDCVIECHGNGTYRFQYTPWNKYDMRYGGKCHKYEELIWAWNQGFPSHPWDIYAAKFISREEMEKEVPSLGIYTKSAAKTTETDEQT